MESATAARTCDGTAESRGEECMELVGSKITANCAIQNIHTTALWDTGSQVSIVSRTWLEKHLSQDMYVIRPVGEMASPRLRVVGMGQQEVPYEGYAILTFSMNNMDELKVPFLVGTMWETPVIGTNIIEHVWEKPWKKEINKVNEDNDPDNDDADEYVEDSDEEDSDDLELQERVFQELYKVFHQAF